MTMGTAAGVSVEVGQKRTWDRWDMVRIYYKSYYDQIWLERRTLLW